MGFFSGRVTFGRYRINGPSPGMFGPEHLERLQSHALGKQKIAAADERTAGARRVQYFLFMQVIEVSTGAIRWQHKAYVTKALR